MRIDEIVEASGEGDERTIKTVNGHFLASAVEIVYVEPEPIPYASSDETRPIQTPYRPASMHYLPA